MKRFKMLSLSVSLVLIVIVIPTLSIIIPVNQKRHSLDQEEKIIKAVEKQSKVIENAITTNAKNMALLQKNLRQKPMLFFLEDQLNASQLSIVSIKPGQDNDDHKIHIVLKGEYRALLNFMAQLSQQANSMALLSFSIEKNRIDMVFQAFDDKQTSIKTTHHSTLLKRAAFALVPIRIPHFSLIPILGLHEVQSPFVSRVLPVKDESPFQSLMGANWCLSGEVRKDNRLVGIFLDADHPSQSRYFGVDLSWENSDWYVHAVTQNTVIFENRAQHVRWALFYRKPAQALI